MGNHAQHSPSRNELLLRRFLGGLVTCVGLVTVYVVQAAIIFAIPAIGGRLAHASIYYPWTEYLLRVIPLFVSLCLSLYAPGGKSFVLKLVGLRLARKVDDGAPTASTE